MKNKHNKSFSIRDWDRQDRPRERLQQYGQHTLTNTELLGILISTGSRSESAVTLAKRILACCDNDPAILASMTLGQLTSFKGIGLAKATTILTALELGRRAAQSQAITPSYITSSHESADLMRPYLSHLKHEEFWVVFLNNSNKVLFCLQVSKGGLTGTLVDIRLILSKALELLAVAIILAHNHPSGSLRPSAADKAITKKIYKAGATLDIKVLDHLILTEKDYFSFADANLL
ncbi:MAG: RadC family protein [Flavicella sp.]